ncbi:glycosyltransferase family 39 protein [Candidatus Woesearchaeota archaeon]|nr:glycosyltransferase family 39 protein [Candidatus Woesearchaeota archaeon]
MDEIEQRKENIKKFFKENKQWLQYILLAVIILLSIYIRAQNLEKLKDVTTGKYISLELDSTVWLRYAKEIVDHGSLPAADHMRFYPVGRDLASLATSTPYFIAYLYKFLHIFISNITLEYVNNIYPLIATAVTLLFFFLFIRRLLNWKTAMLGTLILAIIPSFIFRSMGGSSDHDILGMMLLVMTLYLYTAAWQAESTKKTIVFGVLAGITTILARLTAGSSGFIFMLVGLFVIVEIFLSRFEEKDYYALMSWALPWMLFFTAVDKLGGISSIIYSTITSPASAAVAIGTINFIIFKKKIFKFHERLTFAQEGVVSTLIAIGIILVGALIIAPGYIPDKINDTYQIVFHSFTETRWTLTVAENRKVYVQDWAGQMGGVLYVYAIFAGAVLLFYKMTKEFKKRNRLTLFFALFLFGYVFSRYSGGSILNGESLLSKILFIGSIISFLGIMAYGYFKYYYQEKEEYQKISKLDKGAVFLIIWFLIGVIAATTAIRVLFEFSPISAIFAAFLCIEGYEYLQTRKEKWVQWTGTGIIVLLLFNPIEYGYLSAGILANDYSASMGQVRYSGPGYTTQWQIAGQWARQNTPKDAVFAHWWDYGYWVQSGFERTTVGDGGNSIGWWNYLMARNVLTAQNDTEPLGFLYAHNVSYFLALSDDVGKYPAYSSIGGDQNYDRYSWISTFSLNPQGIQEKRNETLLFFQGGFGLDEDFIYNGVIYPKGQAGVGAVRVPIEKGAQNTQEIVIHQPTALIVYQGKNVELPIRCVFYNNKLYEFKDYGIDSCFRIIPIFTSATQVSPFGAGLYLSRRTAHSLFARLYLLNEETPYFKVAYDDNKDMPLAIYQGRLIGPIKVWKVTYPQGFKLSPEEYAYDMALQYPDPALQKV